MKLIIGCPIYNRAWILPYWFQCIERQSVSLEDIGFVFIASQDDTETLSLLELWRKRHPEVEIFDVAFPTDVNHFSHAEGSRHWTISKYENMVKLRNHLLTIVRKYQPDYFMSLDSDILLTNPNTLELLISHIKEGADAVNPLMYMTPSGTQFPSVMKWVDESNAKATRDIEFPLGTYFKSDVIMAAKMMSQKVYNAIDYSIHSQGEDLGWSAACNKAGFDLYAATYIYAIHVMHQGMLAEVLKNGDPRQEVTMKSLSKA